MEHRACCSFGGNSQKLMESIYNPLLLVHSIGRWILLLLLLIAILKSVAPGNQSFTTGYQKIGLFLTIVADLMLLVGLYLWFTGPRGYNLIEENGMSAVMKNNTLRFFAVEHQVGMLLSIILIHIGKAQGKKNITDKAKHRKTVIFYLLALLIILASIPWPFREVGEGRGWI
jgi:hypothetical protein